MWFYFLVILNPTVQTGLAHPSHVDPPLQQPGSLVGLQRRVAQAGGDDTVGDGVELGHRGSDGGSQVLLSLLIPLRPNPAQAVVGHHLLKEVLDAQTNGFRTSKLKGKVTQKDLGMRTLGN